MLSTTQAAIGQLYIAFFDRAPDQGGLNYWADSRLSVTEIAASFFDQPEAQALYAALDEASFVNALYRNVFEREADAEGFAYWLGKLGALGRPNLVIAMLTAAQGDDALLLANKVEVGLYHAQHGDSSPNAWQVIDRCGLSAESVQQCKDWIDGKIPPGLNPGQYTVLDDPKRAYDLKGTSGDDVFVLKKFLTATIDGGAGDDTVDFSRLQVGVSVNLSTGLVGEGDEDDAVHLTRIENVLGTVKADKLVGNADNNLLVAGGGKGDNIDASVGDDRILFANLRDVDSAVLINGGQGLDTLVITHSPVVDLTDMPVAGGKNLSDIEILQIGYGKDGKEAATVLKVGANGIPLTTFQAIQGTASVDNKGRPTDDVIVHDGLTPLLDVSQVVLSSIEGLENRVAGGRVRFNTQTLESVDYMVGAKDRSSLLELYAREGDTFDLTDISLAGFDRVQQATVAGITLVVDQTLLDTLSGATPGIAFGTGGFASSTLQVAGAGLNLSRLNDGDYNFQTLAFDTASTLIIGAVKGRLTHMEGISGSKGSNDYLSIIHDALEDEDLTDVLISGVERLGVAGVATLRLDNDNLRHGVKFLSGYTDVGGVAITRLAASLEVAEEGLDLRGITLSSIAGVVGLGTLIVDTATRWDAAFKDLGTGHSNTLKLAEAGKYDFSQISAARMGSVSVDALTVSNQPTGDGRTVVDHLLVGEGDKVQGSDGNDTMVGGSAGMGFLLAVGDDRFTGNNKANEWVIGGAGNDSIQLADNLQGNVLATVLLPVALPLGFDGKGGVADGGEGDDVLESGKGNDVLIGGMGHDQLVAGEGHDILAGGAGHDILSGGEGNDLLSGGSGDDVLQGDAGDDVLYAGDGMDVLRGGSLGLAGSKDGQDTFHFAPGDSVPDSQQVDIIVDFLSMRRAVDAVGLTKANAVHDKLVLDWYANDLSPELYAKSPLEALDTLSGKGVVAASGVGYDVLFGHYKDKFAGKASLLEAADAALDDAYTSLNVAGLLAGAGKGGDGKADYLALGVQFEYGAHTYVAVDAYVDKAGAEANRWNPTYDLLVQVDGFAHLAHEKNVWGVTVEAGAALEVVVVRWDTVTL